MWGGVVFLPDDLSRVTEDSARGGFFLFSGSALATVVLAISAILVGRLLGPDLYGQYNLVITVPGLVLLFTDFGINTGVTRFAASLHNEGKDLHAHIIIRVGVWFRFLVGLVATVLSVIFAGYLALVINRPDFAFYVQIASLSIVFQVVYGVSNAAFVGLDRAEYSAVATNVQALAKTVLQVTFVLVSFTMAGVLVGYVGGFVVASIMGASILYFRLLKPVRSRNDSRENPNVEGRGQILNLLAHYGMPLYASTLLAGFLPFYQRIVLGFFTTNASVGSYSAAGNFVVLLAVIPTSITIALLPAFSKLDSSSTHDMVNAFFKLANKYTCLLIVPTTTLLLLFSNQVVAIVYGSAYGSAGLYLAVMVLVYFLVAIGNLSLPSLFNGLGKTRLTLKVTLVNTFVVVVLSPVLSPVYGVVGAILASFIAGLASTSYAAYIGIHELKVNFQVKPVVKTYLAGLLSSLLPLVVLLFMWAHQVEVLVVGTVLFLACYVTLIPLLRIVDEKELTALRRMTAQIRVLNVIAKPVLKYMQKILSLTSGSK
jgi:O-antigen/teichoic acid export membrane protein